MRLIFSDQAWEDYLWWQSPGSERGLLRVNELIRGTMRMPFKGIGKPEPLRGDLTGWWSRRVTEEHRFVYRVSGKDAAQSLEIAQLRYHY